MNFERIYFDVSEELARSAKQAYSFSDYRTGSQTAQYTVKVNAVYDLAEQKIRELDLQGDKAWAVWSLATRYAQRLASWIDRNNRNDASVPSVMIVGSGNFPTARKEKQNNRRFALMAEYEKIEKIPERIENMAADTAIRSGDVGAIMQLTDRIEELKAYQEKMKQNNAHWRKYGTMQGLEGVEDKDVEAIDKEVERCGIPHAGYELSNNLASIKRLEKRLSTIIKTKDTAGETVYDTGGICEVVEDADDMRIRLIFEGKPSEKIRSILKSNGFIWSGKNKAWHRMLNNNGKRAVNTVLELLKEVQ